MVLDTIIQMVDKLQPDINSTDMFLTDYNWIHALVHAIVYNHTPMKGQGADLSG